MIGLLAMRIIPTRDAFRYNVLCSVYVESDSSLMEFH